MELSMARGHHEGPGAGKDGQCQSDWVGERGHWAGEAPGNPTVTSPPRAGVGCNGRMDLTQVATSLFCPDDCFMLDNGTGGMVFIWRGVQGWGHKVI
ncbi:hypothetical protein Nmel_018504 [Mimus melanotis]